MAQIFHRSANTLSRVTIFGAVFIVAFVLWVIGGIVRSPAGTDQGIEREQPVPFSHQHHVAGLGIDCRYCHSSVENSSFAGIPPTHTCMSCHSQVWTEAPMLAPVRQSLATGRPLEWNRVNQVPDFVFFNHSIHVQKGIGCSTCHGEVDQMPLTWKAHSLYMRWCMDCHEAPEKQIRPKDQIYQMDWQPPPDQAKRGAELVKEYQISRIRLSELRDCSMCHR